MTFLELVQAVVREGGTVPRPEGQPATVVGQTGRLGRAVHWTRDAYADIQRNRDDWRWLRREFTGQTITGTARYASSDPRFAHWIFTEEGTTPRFSIYRTDEGRNTEGWLTYLPWEEFRRRALVGSMADDTGQPTLVTVDNENRLVLHPIPDAPYTISGEYYRSPQMLTNDDDVPEMPARFHEAIVWRALLRMGTFDEAPEQMGTWHQFFGEHWDAMLATQTPPVRVGGPLA